LNWLCPRLPGFTWEIFCDNLSVVHQLRRGRKANYMTNKVLMDLASLLQRSGSQIRPTWVSTHDQLADAHTRLCLRPSDIPETFGSIPVSWPHRSRSWPTLIRPFLGLSDLPSIDAPLGFLPTGL
jgi:hypothetical protein